ncbi:DUF6461 domain-containing protein [Nonomuraea typhae]|uniref:DUF6461 domain-containing protein n=1 Tax=Nonomuraea typhae TaxID=2603600 RepID=UPI001FECB1C4|nr:DUF6461 domain-containing protein [Nonomuraea typhae]
MADLGEIYCVSFVRGVAPEEVLRRFGVDEDTFTELSIDELASRSWEEYAEDSAGWIGAASLGDWTVLVEPGGWKTAVDEEVYTKVSHAAELVSVCRHDYANDSFLYAVDGRGITWFDPEIPDSRVGAEPDRLLDRMRRLGLDPDAEEIDDALERAFKLADELTGLTYTPELLDRRFLAAEPVYD